MAFIIAVASDLHLHRRVAPETWDLVVRVFRAAAKADHILIAGDLFDSAGAFEHDSDVVRGLLRRLGLWNADRLSLVPGNHDIFRIPFRGTTTQRLAEAARVLKAGANTAFLAFSNWVSELVPKNARYWSDDVFPFKKRLDGSVLVGADSTPPTTWQSAGGAWPAANDRAVGNLFAGERGVRLLAIHHPPDEATETTFLDRLDGAAFGFKTRDLNRLQRLADAVELDAILCGHIHAGYDRWSWRFGQRTIAHVVGRSGGVHGARPCIGLLTVMKNGSIRWRTARV